MSFRLYRRENRISLHIDMHMDTSTNSTRERLRNADLDETDPNREHRRLLSEDLPCIDTRFQRVQKHSNSDQNLVPLGDTERSNETEKRVETSVTENNKENVSKDLKPKDTQKKKKLISLSIIKDIRFLTFLLASFFKSLPSGSLFLPSLAVSHGLSEFEAAYLLAISAGMDTVFRVIAGLILDMKIFQNKRPIIYNTMTFIQSTIVFSLPSCWSFASFTALMCLEGMVQGVQMAQVNISLTRRHHFYTTSH